MSNGEGYYNGRQDERNKLQPIIERYKEALVKIRDTEYMTAGPARKIAREALEDEE